MHGPSLRFYAFVSRFVDAVTAEAITDELTRTRRAQLFQNAYRTVAQATGTVPAAPSRKAA